jgi:uncharacterized protein (TIGR02001 family)
MNTFSKKLLAAGLSACACTAAVAADKSPVTANVALTTNYVWRGVSQTAEEMALQGGFDYAHKSGFYAGIWGSNVNFGETTAPNGYDRAQLETDVYAGYKFAGAGLDWDVGVLRYLYPGADGSYKYDFTELYVGGAYKMVSVKYSQASDYQGTTTKSGSYLDATLTFDLGSGFGLAAHVGKSSGQGVQDAFGKKYTDTKLELTKDLGDGFSLGLAYTDTNITPTIKKGVSANDGQFFVTLKKTM